MWLLAIEHDGLLERQASRVRARDRRGERPAILRYFVRSLPDAASVLLRFRLENIGAYPSRHPRRRRGLAGTRDVPVRWDGARLCRIHAFRTR